MEKKPKNSKKDKDLSDANTCMGIGVGVGALGAGTAVIAGATCPLCWVVAPALIGIGAVKRIQAKRNINKEK